MSGSKGGGGGFQNVMSVIHPISSYVTHAVLGKEKEWKKTTFGRWLQSPTTKMPESKGAGSAQAVADAASEKSMMAAKEAEKKRLRAAAGRSSLIKTSGRGVLEPADTKKKKLLGA